MIYLVLIGYFIVLVLLLLWQWSNIYSVIIGAPAISSPKHDFLTQFADKDKTFLDLGCGVGSMCLRAAPHFKHVYGIELSPMYYLVSKWRTKKRKNITIIYGNFLK